MGFLNKLFSYMGILILLFSFKTYSFDKLGLEVDMYPFLTGGNYIGLSAAQEGLKYRFIRAESNMPDFMLQDNIDKVELEVYAVILDYYFEKTEYTGPWVGIGVEYWKNEINEKDGVQNYKLNQKIFTLGAGYVFKISENIFINPWTAVHVDLGTENEKQIGNTVYKIKKIIPEASIKIGWYF